MKLAVSPLVDAFGRRIARPVPPSSIADAVERWARQWGRHGRLEWHDALKCFVIHFSRRSDDPTLAAVQAGLRAESTESVMLHEWKQNARPHPYLPGQTVPGWVAMDLEQYGVDGVLAILDRGNLWSGRGEYRTPQEALDQVLLNNERKDRDNDALVEGAARERANLVYRKATGNPQVPVIADLKGAKHQTAA